MHFFEEKNWISLLFFFKSLFSGIAQLQWPHTNHATSTLITALGCIPLFCAETQRCRVTVWSALIYLPQRERRRLTAALPSAPEERHKRHEGTQLAKQACTQTYLACWQVSGCPQGSPAQESPTNLSEKQTVIQNVRRYHLHLLTPPPHVYRSRP